MVTAGNHFKEIAFNEIVLEENNVFDTTGFLFSR